VRRQPFDAVVSGFRVHRQAGAVCLTLVALIGTAACSPALFMPPSGPGAPAPAAAAAWEAAIAPCRAVDTYSALIHLSGRAPRFPTIDVTAAVSAKGAAYLQAQLSGRPLFLLAGDDARASLWLREENRLVTEPLADIVDALVGGLRIDAADLLAFLSGCPLRDPAIVDARQYGDVLAITTADGRAFLELTEGAYRIRAAETAGVSIDYGPRAPGWPGDVTMTTRERRVHLRFRPEQVEINEALPPEMFVVPPAARQAPPMTLEELRTSGPFRR
jgi:hypothetical protein